MARPTRAIAALLLTLGIGDAPVPPSLARGSQSAPGGTGYVRSIEVWRADREASPKADDGWLSLAGLVWLEEGVNRDGTTGSETYPGGRFLYAAMPEHGEVVLDCNKAHSPPCAFTPFATCPLPPKENALSVRVEAGELDPHR